MHKLLIVLVFLCFLTNMQAMEEAKVVEGIPATYERVLENTISLELNTLVREIAATFGFTQEFIVAYPTEEFIQFHPKYHSIHIVQVPKCMIIINKKWIDSLDNDGKLYRIAAALQPYLTQENQNACQILLSKLSQKFQARKISYSLMSK